MCGICGVVDATRPVDRQLVGRMAALIAHRGPDGDGYFFNEGSQPSVGLGARRLAIIDRVAGDQPIANEDNTIQVVYNGEIFNHVELRTELEQRGHSFRTHCDTEVVVHAYEQWGDDAVSRFNGMFAFALWDSRRNRLLLARDRMGVKPLVYYHDGARLVFASEIKSLLADPAVPRVVDPDVLLQYLSFFAVPEPNSLLKGIRRLPAGHLAVFENGRLRTTQYWDVTAAEGGPQSDNAWLDELEATLADSVRIRLNSEVPLGVFLSGGIDSSLMVALMARTGVGIKSSSIEFEPGYSEAKYARAVVAAFGTDHRSTSVDRDQALQALPAMVWHHDEPSQSLIQSWFVSKAAHQDMTVALSGLGADELFTGYPGHVAAHRIQMLERVPGWLRKGTRTLLTRSASQWAGRVVRYLDATDSGPDQIFASRFMQSSSAADRGRVLSRDVLASVRDEQAATAYLLRIFAAAKARDFAARMLYVDQKAYLVNELLRTCDSMSMAHSLEVRTPFLDVRVVELAARMPMRMKIRGQTTKYALRRLAARMLPPEIARRSKVGFTVPLDNWIVPAAQPMVRDHLTRAALDRHGLFDSGHVNTMLDDHFAGRANHSHWILALLTFQIWHAVFIEQTVAPPLPASVGAV
jgi:asparagine synthase (glutamine-hydrolysing)